MRLSYTRFFAADFKQASAVRFGSTLRQILKCEIPGFTGYQRTENTDHDKAGTDVLVYRRGRKPLRVDLKIAGYDPQERFGSDDVAMEVTSVVEDDKPGWALRNDANTDLVLWLYPTGRYVLLSFRRLRAALRKNLKWWSVRFRQTTNRTYAWGRYYHSRCLFVPRAVLQQAIDALAWS